jgi:hypothetical protein
MKKTLFVGLAAAGLLATGAARATADEKAKADEGKTVTVTGCLREAPELADAFVLGGDKTYRIAPSSDVKLKEHVGHQVQITGKVMAKAAMPGAGAAAPSSGTTAPSSGTTAPTAGTGAAGAGASTPKVGAEDLANAPQLSVTSLKHMADTCTK